MNTYSDKFKKEAVRLLNVSEKPAAHEARDLGIRKNVLYQWRDEYGDRSEVPYNAAAKFFSHKTSPK